MSERVEDLVRLFFLGVFCILLIVYLFFAFHGVPMSPKCKDNLIDKPRGIEKERPTEKSHKDTIYIIVAIECAQTRNVNN